MLNQDVFLRVLKNNFDLLTSKINSIKENAFSGNYNDLTNQPVLELRTTYASKTAAEGDYESDGAYVAHSFVVPNVDIDPDTRCFMDLIFRDGSIATYELIYERGLTEDSVECDKWKSENDRIYVVNSASIKDIFAYNKFYSNDTNMCAITIGFISNIVSIELYSTEIVKRLNTKLLPRDIYVDNSISIGSANIKGSRSFAIGTDLEVYGDNSFAGGNTILIDGDDSFAYGESLKIERDYSAVFGYGNEATNVYNFIMGTSNLVRGEGSLSFGSYNKVSGYYSIALGNNLTIPEGSYDQIALGRTNIADPDAILIVGDGNISAQSNALSIYEGGKAYFKGDVYSGEERLVTEADVKKPQEYITLKDEATGHYYTIQMYNGVFTVKPIAVSIEITSGTRTSYCDGEKINVEQTIVKAIYADGTYSIIDSSELIAVNYANFEDAIATIKYVDHGVELFVTFDIEVQEFDPNVILIDFDYIDNGDGTYTLTGWKETLNGEPSTFMVVPDNNNIII